MKRYDLESMKCVTNNKPILLYLQTKKGICHQNWAAVITVYVIPVLHFNILITHAARKLYQTLKKQNNQKHISFIRKELIVPFTV